MSTTVSPLDAARAELSSFGERLIGPDNPLGVDPDDPNGADDVIVEADDLHLPIDAVRSAAPGTRLAGKVVGTDGLLLVDWQLGDRELTSGFRADDHDQHRRLADAITALLSPEEVRR